MRKLIKEYQEALVRQNQVLKMQKPGNRVYDVYSKWLNKNKPLIGYGKNLLQEPRDFVALAPPEDSDRLSMVVRSIAGRCWGYSKVDDVIYFSDETVHKIIGGVSILLAAFLLEGAIVALYLVANPHLRLGLIAVFVVLFAGGIGLLSNAKRSEMFAATAAYAAVLVVFISGSFSNG